MLRLPDNEIHLWCVDCQTIPLNLSQDYQLLLNSEERVRWQRFKFEKHQRQYLITRVLVRTTLSKYAQMNPKDWQFSKNDYGKPAVFPSQNLFFNLSHTENLIVCAVSRQKNIGVDVETITHKSSTVEIAQRFFSPNETKALLRELGSVQKQHFFQYWTLKEAYIKAKGVGLSLPLEQFSFDINHDKKKLRLSFESSSPENAKHWSCWLFDVGKPHYLSVCVYNPHSMDYQLTAKHVIPFQKVTNFDYTLLAKT
ncbi:MAG: 4'-phosphopantetheinyl transferase superfamily protein [Methylococcales bacterium]|nr:4'-phosphopantetheinyl transferase superfamily protein [Methylococcales bacterium]